MITDAVKYKSPYYSKKNSSLYFGNTGGEVINVLSKSLDKIKVNSAKQAPEMLEQVLNSSNTILSDVKSTLLEPEVIAQKDGKFIEFMGKLLKKIGNTKAFGKLVEMKGKNTTSYIIATGNALKEAVGTVLYTVQALTNEDLPPDKRKFVGMYDLGVGVVSTTLSFLFGLGVVPFQDDIAKKLVGKKMAALPGFKVAVAGIAFLIPTVLQQILIKRVVAPAVATPVAGKLKKKLEEKEAGGKQVELTATDLTVGMPKVDDKSNSTLPSSTNLLQNAKNLNIKA